MGKFNFNNFDMEEHIETMQEAKQMEKQRHEQRRSNAKKYNTYKKGEVESEVVEEMENKELEKAENVVEAAEENTINEELSLEVLRKELEIFQYRTYKGLRNQTVNDNNELNKRLDKLEAKLDIILGSLVKKEGANNARI